MPKRRSLLFLIILVICAGYFLFSRASSFILCNAVPVVLRHKYGVDISFGDIHGGIKRGISIPDFRFSGNGISASAGEVRTDIKFKDIIFRDSTKKHKISIITPRIEIDACTPSGILGRMPQFINGEINILSGRLIVKGSGKKYSMPVCGSLAAKNGSIARINDMLVFGIFRISGKISNSNYLRLKLSINNASGKALSCILPANTGSILDAHKISADACIYGHPHNIQAGGILKMSSDPLNIFFRYRNNVFSFRTAGGSAVNFSGSAGLDNPAYLKIKGSCRNMDINDIISLMGRRKNKDWKGRVSAVFSISGSLQDPHLDADIDIKNALLGPPPGIRFDTAYINVSSSAGGRLLLTNSVVHYKDAEAELSGYIDLSSGPLFKNIEVRPLGDSFIWNGVNIARDKATRVVSFGRDVNKNVSVRFKSILTSDPEKENTDKKPQIELEYKLRRNKNILFRVQEGEETVGIEHKMKF